MLQAQGLGMESNVAFDETGNEVIAVVIAWTQMVVHIESGRAGCLNKIIWSQLLWIKFIRAAWSISMGNRCVA